MRILRALCVALLLVPAVLALALFPSDRASALVAPAPLPVSLSSELAALARAGGFTATEAAAAAGSSSVAATAAAPGSLIAGGLVTGFLVGSTSVGAITRATGGSTTGLCAAGQFLAGLYGQDCSQATVAVSTSYTPNGDAVIGSVVTLRSNDGSATVTIDFGRQVKYRDFGNGPSSEYWGFPATITGADAGTFGPTYVSSDRPGTGAGFGGFTAQTSTAGWWATAGGTFLGQFDKATLDVIQDRILTKLRCLTLTNGCDAGHDGVAAGAGPDTIGTVPKASADPLRYFQAVATFTDGSTNSASSREFRESDASIPQYPLVPSTGRTLQSLVVREWLADGSDSKVVLSQTVSPEYAAAADAYPECSTGLCKLQVFVRGKACSVGASTLCEDWFYQDAAANSITCRYGTHVVDLAECNVLASYYKPAAQAAGTPYSDPETGAPVSTPTAAGSATPTATTPSSSGKDCFGQAYGTFDPAAWVLAPVKCGLQWAFVPDPAGVKASAAAVSTAWQNTPPVQVVNAVRGFASDLPKGVSGCSGIHATFPGILGVKPVAFNILNACEDPVATMATVARLILDVSVGIWGLLALTRYAGLTIGFGGLGKDGA